MTADVFSHATSVSTPSSPLQEPGAVSPFLSALPPALREQLEALMASSAFDLQRKALSSTHRLTPTEEDSCSCATCGSTCCNLV